MKVVQTVGNFTGSVPNMAWPKETLVIDQADGIAKRMLVFTRCRCGSVIPVDYLECSDCNPARQITSCGSESRDELRIRGIRNGR